MQVFIYTDRGFTRELAERAAAAGYDALVLTIDNQLLGNRERDLRNGFTIPPRFGVPARSPRWRSRRGGSGACARHLGRITFGNYVRPGETAEITALAGRMAALLDPSMSWRDVDELRQIWRGPLILKGVLHPAEAKEALAHGVDGAGGLEPRRPPARRGAGHDRGPAGGRRGGRRAAFRCCSMAASGAAATSSRRWRSARAPA